MPQQRGCQEERLSRTEEHTAKVGPARPPRHDDVADPNGVSQTTTDSGIGKPQRGAELNVLSGTLVKTLAAIRITFVAGLTLSSRTAAQGIAGRVVSAGGEPLASVTVWAGTASTSSNPDGRFEMSGLTGSSILVRLRRLGYAPRDTLLQLAPAGITRLDIAMSPVPPRLDTVAVRAPATTVGTLVEFEERRARGMGKYITRDQLRKSDNRRFADVLRSRLPGLGLQEQYGSTLVYHAGMPPRNALASKPQPCYVQVIVDGLPIYQGSGMGQEPPDFALLLTTEFDGVEWYSSPSRTPVQFRRNAAACGTLVLWSRRK